MTDAISPEKWAQLTRRMSDLGIVESDLSERFIAGSGKGGQKVNKTASCVQLKHGPTGTEIKCQKSRSRDANRFFARRLLCERIEAIQLGNQSPQAQKLAKIRKQKKRRARRAKKTEPNS